jgi:uncharacterized protein
MLLFVRALSGMVRRAPALVLVAALVLTGVLVALSAQAETAAGNEGFAPDNPELLASETLSERFGDTGEDVMQILVDGQGSDLISGNGLRAVLALREAITSADAAEHLAERPDRPAILSFLDPVLMAAEQAELPLDGLSDAQVTELYVDALAQMPEEQAALVTGLLPDGADAASGSADTGLMLVFLDTSHITGEGTEQWDQLIEMETGLADAVADADLPWRIDASAFSFALLFADDGSFNAELARLFGSAFAIILLILGFVYWLKPGLGLTRFGAGRRTVADVLLTMLTIVMAISWMNGIAVLLGPDFLGVIGYLTEVSQIIPVLLIGLGVDYAIHLTSRYREEVGHGATTAEGVSRAVHTVGVALVLATMTTAVGFLTNIINPVPALKDFGIVAAVGIVSSFVLMLTFVPSVRLLLDRRAERAGRLPAPALGRTGERFLPQLMGRAAFLAERTPIPTLLVTVLLGGALGVWGLTELDTRFSATDFVPEDSPVVATFDAITEEFGGGFGEQTQVLLEGDLATPAAHNALVDAQAGLADVEHVSGFNGEAAVESPVSVLGMLLAPAPDGTPSPIADVAQDAGVGEDLKVDSDADVSALYTAMLDAAPEMADRVLDTDSAGAVELGRVAIQTTAGETGARELAADLREVFAPVEAAGVTAVATSNPIINNVIITALQDSQVSSLVVTLLAAMLLLVVTFWVEARRPLLGVLTIAPVALVVLWTFGMMAATGIPFGPITATIAALAIGIGVPYTIHITHRYQEDRLRYTDPAEAIRSTVRHTGGALAGSAFTTMAGFGILVTSSLTPFRQFGLVTAYAIGFALFAATVVLPSMLILWDRWHRRRDEPPVEPQPSLERAVGV